MVYSLSWKWEYSYFLQTILLVLAIQVARAVGQDLGTECNVTRSLCKTGSLWSFCNANSNNTLTSTELSFLFFHWQHIWACHPQDELLFLILHYQLVKRGRNAYTTLWNVTLVQITLFNLKKIKPVFYHLLHYLEKKCSGEKHTWTFCCLATAKYQKAKAVNALE